MSQQLWQGKKVQVHSHWYSPCIRSSVWLKSLPEDLYVEILCFIKVNWKKHSNQMKNENLLRYITSLASRGVASASNVAERTSTGLESVSKVADGIRIYLFS